MITEESLIRVMKKAYYTDVSGHEQSYEFLGLLFPHVFKQFWNPGERIKISQSGLNVILVERKKKDD